MCGIAGLLGQFPTGTVAAMGERLAARGPDGGDVFEDAPVALAHRRLSIIDLSSAGHQPMTEAGGRYTISYNGEIYNYRELRAELLARGRQLRGHSDTEAIVELFADEGPSLFARLNGIFAIAIWDARDRVLWLARDGMGVKPLYLTRTSHGLAFASEIKALLPVPGLDRSIDRVAVAAYLGYLYSPGERTMFASVRKLEPGSWLRVGADGTESRGVFYTPPAYAPDLAMTEAQAIAGTTEHLARAVERQMIADVEVGAFLSGGLDSSAIVAFARAHSAQRMQCFTIDYRASDGDDAELIADLPYARAAAEHLGVTLHEVQVDARIATEFEDVVHMLDEPQADPAAINSLKIAALARQHGIKVLLSGAGGDDVFTGYRRHKAVALDARLAFLPAPARRVLGLAGRHLPGEGTTARRLRKLLAPMGEDASARLLAYFEWLRLEDASALIAGGQDVPLADEARAPMAGLLASLEGTPPIEQALRLERFFLTDHNLNYTDKTGMAVGVETRVPFLDPDLMAFAATVPTGFKLHGGETKYCLRKAMEPLLPHNVIYRPKTGFGVPLRAWMRGPLKPLVADALSPASVARRGLFDHAAVTRLREATEAGRVDGHYTLLALMTIELWCRRFVDAPVPVLAAA